MNLNELRDQLQSYLDQLSAGVSPQDSPMGDEIALKLPGKPLQSYVLFNEMGRINNFPEGLISVLIALDFLKHVVQEQGLQVSDDSLLQAAVSLSKGLVVGSSGATDQMADTLEQISEALNGGNSHA